MHRKKHRYKGNITYDITAVKALTTSILQCVVKGL